MKWFTDRSWLVKGLLAIACILMLVSFLLPWWVADVGQGRAVHIYGWGIRHNMEQLSSFVAEDVTPLYQTILAWIYLMLSIGMAVISIGIKGKKGGWLLGSIGLIYIAYTAITVFVIINNRIADLPREIPLLGSVTFVNMSGNTILHTALQPGYYLANVAGLILIILALLRGRFINRSELDHN